MSKLHQPLFIFGPPRSGTTFLTALLNSDPRIFITNELRVCDFVNSVMREKATDQHLLHNAQYREEFIARLEPNFSALIAEFYCERLEMKLRQHRDHTFGVWGDKTPGYGDPKLSPGCLETIDRLFPDAKFILLVRHPLAVVSSIVRKGWETLDGAVDLWARIIANGRRFGAEIGERFLEIRYEALLETPELIFSQIIEFLALGSSPQMREFLLAQQRERTPFAAPESWGGDVAMEPQQRARISELLGENLNNVEVALACYRKSAGGVRSGDSFDAKLIDELSASAASRAVDANVCSGEGAARICRFSVKINGEPQDCAQDIQIEVGMMVEIAMELTAHRAIEKLVLGYNLSRDNGQHIDSQTSASAGLAQPNLVPGKAFARLQFKWRQELPGRYSLTLVVGEGEHPTNHIRQCWVHDVLRFNVG